MAGPDTTVERVRVDGEPGFWLAGAPHALIYEDPSGAIRESPHAARRPHPGLAARRSHAAPRGRRHQVAGARDRPLRPMRREPTMQRMLVLAAVAALALAAAPAAVAKEIKQAQVCGADGCTTVDDEDDRAVAPQRRPAAHAADAPRRSTRCASRSTPARGTTDRFEVAAVPERRALRGDDGTWMEMPPEMRRRRREARRGPPAVPGRRPDRRRRRRPSRARRAADAGSPLWPEGVLLALVPRARRGCSSCVARRAASRQVRRRRRADGPARERPLRAAARA